MEYIFAVLLLNAEDPNLYKNYGINSDVNKHFLTTDCCRLTEKKDKDK